jgi:hypothetical protein
MNSRPELRVDWCSHDAAKYACLNWHYSKCMPAGKIVRVGVWEAGKFIGVVLFGRGANLRGSAAYGLPQTEACELVRIALKEHKTPVSRISAIAVKLLRKQSPGLRLIFSYADPIQGHNGGIYQAGNWIYVGSSKAQSQMVIDGRPVHKRSAFAKYGTSAVHKIEEMSGLTVGRGPVEWKHTYLMPLDDAMREQIARLSKPYPKRAKQAMAEHPSAQRQGSTDPHAPDTEEARHAASAS